MQKKILVDEKADAYFPLCATLYKFTNQRFSLNFGRKGLTLPPGRLKATIRVSDPQSIFADPDLKLVSGKKEGG